MKRSELIKILRRISPAVDSGSKTLEASLVTFGDGFIGAFDGQIRIFCPAPIKLDRNCSVSAKAIMALLGKMKDEEINITFSPKKNLLKIGVSERMLQSKVHDKEFPDLKVKQDNFSPLPKDFISALGMCAFAMSRVQMTMELSNACVTAKHIYSTDTQRASRFTFSSEFPLPDGAEYILLPYDLVNTLLKVDQPIAKVYFHKGSIHFQGRGKEGLTISHPASVGEYPIKMLEKYLGKGEAEEYFVLPSDMTKILERINAILPKAKQGTVVDEILIKPTEGGVSISCESDAGFYEEVSSVDTPLPEDKAFRIRAEFLSDVVGFTKKFRFTEDGKGVVFIRNRFKHIMTFLRPQEELSKEE